jgi:hypothetical protein
MMRIIVPAATTMLVVVLLIGVNGYNRSGDPLQRITLTEREARMSWGGPDDGRGVRLRIDYQGRFDPFDARNWLTEERLRALGFVSDVMPGAPEAGDTYRRLLPRTAWVAFQLDGEAWRDIERRRQLAESSTGPRVASSDQSHLVPVDASLDRDLLVARYPMGHLVLRASIQVGYVDPSNKGPLVYGYIRWIIPADLSVPRALGQRLTDLPGRNEQGSPRYEVDIAVGQVGIPYVTDIRLLR